MSKHTSPARVMLSWQRMQRCGRNMTIAWWWSACMPAGQVFTILVSTKSINSSNFSFKMVYWWQFGDFPAVRERDTALQCLRIIRLKSGCNMGADLPPELPYGVVRKKVMDEISVRCNGVHCECKFNLNLKLERFHMSGALCNVPVLNLMITIRHKTTERELTSDNPDGDHN